MEIIYVVFLTFFSALFAVSTDVDISILWFDPSKFVAYILGIPQKKNIEIEDDEEDEIEEDKQIKREEIYDDKYKIEFRNMSDSKPENGDNKSWESTYIVEHTPLGNVFMSYDSNRETFVYYADHIIPFRFLEVVSRKFALSYHCKHLVVDVELEEQKMMEEETEEKTENEDTEEKKVVKEITAIHEPSGKVFAKFKSYNQQQSGPSAVGVKETTKFNNKKSVLVVEKSNRYSCQGKIANMIFLKKPKKDINERHKMSFAEFKKTLL